MCFVMEILDCYSALEQSIHKSDNNSIFIRIWYKSFKVLIFKEAKHNHINNKFNFHFGSLPQNDVIQNINRLYFHTKAMFIYFVEIFLENHLLESLRKIACVQLWVHEYLFLESVFDKHNVDFFYKINQTRFYLYIFINRFLIFSSSSSILSNFSISNFHSSLNFSIYFSEFALISFSTSRQYSFLFLYLIISFSISFLCFSFNSFKLLSNIWSILSSLRFCSSVSALWVSLCCFWNSISLSLSNFYTNLCLIYGLCTYCECILSFSISISSNS